MIKRILIPLDNSEYTESAKNYAFEIAGRHDAILEGIGTVDIEAISKEGIGAGIGSSYYAEKIISTLTKDAERKIEELIRSFEEDCKRRGVRYEEVVKKGVPAEAIMEDSNYHDLIIMGQKSFFHFETRDRPGDTLKKVAERSIRPILTVPKTFRDVKKVIAAVDGKGKDSRAIFSFIHLKPYPIEKITLLHVVPKATEDAIERGEWMLSSYEKYLRAHKIPAERKILIGGIDTEILRYIKEKEIDLLIMGYSIEKGIRELLFGSYTERILEEAGIPIFLFR